MLLFFAITAAAVVFVYLYVVPQLRSSLTVEKLHRLESAAADQGPRLASALQTGRRRRGVRALVRDAAQRDRGRG